MRNGFLVQALSLSMAVILPATMAMGEMKGAILRTTGGALLNGVVAKHGSTVLRGDTIQAPNGSPVSLSASGSTVVLTSASRAQYQGESINLQAGDAQVTTSAGMTAKVDRITVKPVAKSGSFEVATKDGKVTVTALKGSVSLFDDAHSMVVPEGNMATLDTQDDKTPRAGAEWDKERGWGMSRKVAILIGVGAAGAAGAILWATTDSPSDISPTH